MSTYTFRVEGMHCASCGLLIDDVLMDVPGVSSTQTSVKQGRCIVELDAGGCSAADVITAIEGLGYTAHPMT